MFRTSSIGFPRTVVFSVLLLASIQQQARAQDDLARQAYRILEKHCYDCHGVDDNFEGLNVLKRTTLLEDRGALKNPFVSPGAPDKSKLFIVIADGRMPIGEKLPQTEQDILRKWIEGGAPFPVVSRIDRPFVSERDILKAIRDDQRSLSQSDQRAYTRYFSLAHLHNNPNIDEKQLRYTRAALSKAVNSLSHEARIVLPRAIDPAQAVLAVDLRDVGWDFAGPGRGKGWMAVLGTYPYGVEPTTDFEAGDMYGEITAHFNGNFSDKACYMRADWFVDAATRPPLYHELAQIPATLGELAVSLGIQHNNDGILGLKRNVMNGRIVRAAVLKSGVSSQNRLVDRHECLTGAFWVSYDFAANSGRSNVARFPLGPQMEEAELRYKYKQHAFQEDGSEIIWELKNGMHGYMIANAKGDRIDRAPVSIVWNKAQANSNPEVVNGATCMGCHTQGIRDFTDILLDGHALNDREAIQFLRDIVPPQAQMKKEYVEPDRTRYLRVLTEVTGPFLQVGEDKDKEITRFPEPISKVVNQYSLPLTINEAAFEVGLEDPKRLQYSGLRKVGLGILERDGGVVQRSFWAPTVNDSSTRTITIFETVVNHLDLGQPKKAN